MTRPLSNDLRKRVVAAVAKGESCRSVALRFGVAVSSVVSGRSAIVRPVRLRPARCADTASACSSRIVPSSRNGSARRRTP
jgi:transposase-like protein